MLKPISSGPSLRRDDGLDIALKCLAATSTSEGPQLRDLHRRESIVYVLPSLARSCLIRSKTSSRWTATSFGASTPRRTWDPFTPSSSRQCCDWLVGWAPKRIPCTLTTLHPQLDVCLDFVRRLAGAAIVGAPTVLTVG